MNEEVKPQWYFEHYFTKPNFYWSHYSLGIYIGRVKGIGEDLVFNVYMPWFQFGYAW